jgi:hypothetical protein
VVGHTSSQSESKYHEWWVVIALNSHLPPIFVLLCLSARGIWVVKGKGVEDNGSAME